MRFTLKNTGYLQRSGWPCRPKETISQIHPTATKPEKGHVGSCTRNMSPTISNRDL